MSLVKIATLVSTLTALILMIIKLTIWIISWSIAVLSSAIDSMLDMFVSVFNYFAVSNSEKNPDNEFNYGRWKIEAIAALFEWLVITLSWLYILYESVIKIINNEKIWYLWIWLVVMLVSVFVTFWLVTFLDYVAKKTNNLVIKSDSLHYKTDLYSNAWILVWLVLIYYTWINYIDWIIWIFIAIYIIYSAYTLIKKWFLLLLDIALEKEEVDKIKEIIKSQKLVTWFHELKTRQSWNTKFVEVHIVFNPEIKLIDAHRISDHIEYTIPKIDTMHTREILVHMDPYDDCKDCEKK